MKRLARPDRAILAQLRETHSNTAIGLLYDVGARQVRKWSRFYGLPDRRETLPPLDQASFTILALDTNDQAMGRLLGVTGDTIRWWRKKWGVPNATPRPGPYDLDERFFQTIDTEAKAYILGFIAADGSVSRFGLTFGLHPRDTHILEIIRNALSHTGPITPDLKSPWPKVIYTIYSIVLVADLLTHGITPNKSLTLRYPSLPQSLERHYIRGLWDGDGHVSKHSFGLAGSQGTLEGVQATLLRETGLLMRMCPQGNIFQMRGGRGKQPILQWLYTNATIYLQRKYTNYQVYWLKDKQYQMRLFQ
jgi:hypothetical protein